jgi:hypothetical protein
MSLSNQIDDEITRDPVYRQYSLSNGRKEGVRWPAPHAMFSRSKKDGL